jgi:CDP-glucose 4,6-dehydratase
VKSQSSFWIDRPVFVTGATGLLGSWLVKQLVKNGADTVALVRDWVPQSELVASSALEKIKTVRGDVRDQELIERILGEYEIDTVFHLAAQTIVGVANRNPVSTFDVNIQGTVSVLEAGRRSPLVKQIIVASSDKAYGDQEVLPYDENTPLQGRHPYDASKSCADLVSQSYWTTFETPVCVTRCGNFYGGGDLNWNRLVPGTIRSAIRGERPIIRSDGTYIRDYFYIEDGAIAYMALAEAMAGDRSLLGEAFNFSNELQINVLDLVKKILKITNRPDLKPDIRNEAASEIKNQYLSAKKAREHLGWAPSFTLEEGLAKTYDWYARYFKKTKTID